MEQIRLPCVPSETAPILSNHQLSIILRVFSCKKQWWSARRHEARSCPEISWMPGASSVSAGLFSDEISHPLRFAEYSTPFHDHLVFLRTASRLPYLYQNFHGPFLLRRRRVLRLWLHHNKICYRRRRRLIIPTRCTQLLLRASCSALSRVSLSSPDSG